MKKKAFRDETHNCVRSRNRTYTQSTSNERNGWIIKSIVILLLKLNGIVTMQRTHTPNIQKQKKKMKIKDARPKAIPSVLN